MNISCEKTAKLLNLLSFKAVLRARYALTAMIAMLGKQARLL